MDAAARFASIAVQLVQIKPAGPLALTLENDEEPQGVQLTGPESVHDRSAFCEYVRERPS